MQLQGKQQMKRQTIVKKELYIGQLVKDHPCSNCSTLQLTANHFAKQDHVANAGQFVRRPLCIILRAVIFSPKLICSPSYKLSSPCTNYSSNAKCFTTAHYTMHNTPCTMYMYIVHVYCTCTIYCHMCTLYNGVSCIMILVLIAYCSVGDDWVQKKTP